ncbi:MAG: helix-turn-helix transcriptional regulator [Phycisphaerales bacterium]|nr:helix-turn-helix transcriptional regulator [Phycisphaerales bacterium]
MGDLLNQREAELLAITINGERYGRDIRNQYEQRTDRKLPLGSLYVTLDRMEDKGYLTSRMGESAHNRGGYRRKYYKITGAGQRALNAYQIAVSACLGRLSGA